MNGSPPMACRSSPRPNAARWTSTRRATTAQDSSPAVRGAPLDGASPRSRVHRAPWQWHAARGQQHGLAPVLGRLVGRSGRRHADAAGGAGPAALLQQLLFGARQPRHRARDERAVGSQHVLDRRRAMATPVEIGGVSGRRRGQADRRGRQRVPIRDRRRALRSVHFGRDGAGIVHIRPSRDCRQSSVSLVLGARGDFWRSTPREDGAPLHAVNFFSPRAVGGLADAAGVALRASVTHAYRTPTLDELHRTSQVGNTMTLSNTMLNPEVLTGLEAGALFTASRVSTPDHRVLEQPDRRDHQHHVESRRRRSLPSRSRTPTR